MALFVRMMIYLLAGVLAGQGLVIFDQEAGTITFRVEDVTTVLTGLLTFGGAYLASRIAKARGGLT